MSLTIKRPGVCITLSIGPRTLHSDNKAHAKKITSAAKFCLAFTRIYNSGKRNGLLHAFPQRQASSTTELCSTGLRVAAIEQPTVWLLAMLITAFGSVLD